MSNYDKIYAEIEKEIHKELPVGVVIQSPDELFKYDREKYHRLTDALIKDSKLYTAPKPEYDEPNEPLYDWYTGKVRR